MANTPRKFYCRHNICILCGFSFVQTKLQDDGSESEVKFFKFKLRLNSERLDVIHKVLDIGSEDCTAINNLNNGVCKKCYAQVEKVSKLQNDSKTLLDKLKSSRTNVEMMTLTLPSPSKRGFTKRMAKSPVRPPTTKQLKSFPTVVRKSPIKLLTMDEVLARRVPILPMPVGETTKQTATHPTKKVEKPIVRRSLFLPADSDDDDVHSLGGSEQEFSDERAQVSELRSSEKDDNPDPEKTIFKQPWPKKVPSTCEQSQAEVMISVYYASGKKSFYVEDDIEKKICKAAVRGQGFSKSALGLLSTSKPTDVVETASKIIAKECREICKRNSGSVLQQKNYQEMMTFTWEKFSAELKSRCPGLLSFLSAAFDDRNILEDSKAYRQLLMTAANCLHGRFQEMSAIQYIVGFILTHGGCTQQDIQKLSHIGLTMHPVTLHLKLSAWEASLDAKIKELKHEWADGGYKKYQIIGDNWDKNILPSFRTSDRKTQSLHLFNMYAIVDRVVAQPETGYTRLTEVSELDVSTFIPSKSEQEQLMKELTFLFSTSLVSNHPQLNTAFCKIYPKHLIHCYSHLAGKKTEQYPLGLADCNENKTQDVIQLLTKLSDKYVPMSDGEIVESVFFGGDRLTDERIQCAQEARLNERTPKDRLEGFISKIEDFHRLMNFLEGIQKLSYSTKSGNDQGTVYYYRNLLNLRNVKGNVKNAYRPYKLLYYIVLDAISLLLFLNHLELENIESEVCFPEGFRNFSDAEKVEWLDSVSQTILKKWFFEDSNDIFESLRNVMNDPDHPENYWLANLNNDRVQCHFCDKTYAYVGSLQTHEAKCHNVKIEKPKKKEKSKDADDLQDHLLMVFKIVLLHRNLDSAVDMADGWRSVRSAKYELPLYNRTNKVKYTIGSVHLTALTSGVLPHDQTERLVANRCVNVQGGQNNNIALDEYLEMLNRDSKVACGGYKTKESIIMHSKEFPHLTESLRNFESICNIRRSKGFHHLPNYSTDVQKVLVDLLQLEPLKRKPKRQFHCKELVNERNLFDESAGLARMIHRHKPSVPFRRLRKKNL